MKQYTIEGEICLGMACAGSGVYEYYTATVELEDEQVEQLVELIRENDGETDVVALDLEDELPEVYETLQEAISDAACEAAFRHWALYGFADGAFDEPDDLMERLEEDGHFKYNAEEYLESKKELGEDEYEEYSEYDEDELKDEAFSEWFDEYYNSLSEDEQYEFLKEYYTDNLDGIDVSDTEYEVVIPDEIIRMAEEESEEDDADDEDE